jgi:hypothetical protein
MSIDLLPPAGSQTRSLPDAEWYMFYDARMDEEDCLRPNQYDAESPYTGHLSDESSGVYRKRASRMLELFPQNTNPNSDWIFKDKRQAISPDMVHRDTWFSIRKPVGLEHHLTVACLSPHAQVGYVVVSAEWRCAIESVEPSIHEFFPHTFNFVGGTYNDRYIFRNRIVRRGFVHPISSTTVSRASDIRTMSHAIGSPPPHVFLSHQICMLEIDATSIREHHWVDLELSLDCTFVSKLLAMKLWALLPNGVTLLPMACKN